MFKLMYYKPFDFQGINQVIAKKMIDDRTREYLNARRVSKELEANTRSLQRHNAATPPPGSSEEIKQVLTCYY